MLSEMTKRTIIISAINGALDIVLMYSGIHVLLYYARRENLNLAKQLNFSNKCGNHSLLEYCINVFGNTCIIILCWTWESKFSETALSSIISAATSCTFDVVLMYSRIQKRDANLAPPFLVIFLVELQHHLWCHTSVVDRATGIRFSLWLVHRVKRWLCLRCQE